MKMNHKVDMEWIKKQIEALPYLMAAVGVCGMLWLFASLFVVICED